MKVITTFFDKLVQRYLPDAFLFAILLTLIVFLMGTIFTPHSSIQMVAFWGDGFWDLLPFAMQMSLIVVTGYILANTPIVKRFLAYVSKLANTPGQAIILVTVITSLSCLLNYGFGLVVGALLSIHVARRMKNIDYRLLVASAYSGFLFWHAGLSASAPLLVATPDHFLEDVMGTIPVKETIFSPVNIFIVVFLLLTLPLLNWLLFKSQDPSRTKHPILENDEAQKSTEAASTVVTPADRLENSRILSILLGIIGLVYIAYYFTQNGFDLNINIVNFIMLFLGILFHQTPRHFLNSISEGVKNIGGIVIQFPFYAGIMGMMISSGLSENISLWFIDVSTTFTFPLFAFISAGIINIFVPSGGGQWAVQAPIMIPAALELGVEPAKTTMAIAWGDAWTNMIQPFWALPLLAIAGLKARDIMGFCVIILFYSFIPISLGLLLF